MSRGGREGRGVSRAAQWQFVLLVERGGEKKRGGVVEGGMQCGAVKLLIPEERLPRGEFQRK